MAFSYPDPQPNPYAASIADLMLRQGDIKAQGALRTGAIQANEISAVGNDIAAIPGQIQKQQLTQQQIESGGIDLQTKKMNLARMQAIQQAWATPGGIDKVLAAMPPDARMDLQKMIDDSSEAHSKAMKATDDANLAQADAFGRTAAGVAQLGNDPAVAQGALSTLLDQYADRPAVVKQLQGFQQQLHDTPTVDTVKTITSALMAASPKQRELAAQERTAAAREATAAKPPATTIAGLALAAHPDDPAGALEAAKEKAPPTPAPAAGSEADAVLRARRIAVQANGGTPLTDQQIQGVDAKAMASYKEQNADPEIRAAALAQKNMAVTLEKMRQGQQPTAADAQTVADDLVNHRQSPSQVKLLFGTRGVEGQDFMLKVNTAAKQLDPTFNYEEAEASYQLAKSTGFQNTVRYMDSALESIPRLEANAKNLGNGRFRTLNQIANAAKNEFNSTDLKRFKTDALLVGDEVAKILSGGGTGSATSDAKLKQATDLIGTSDSVPAIAASMEEITALMGNRRRALTRGTYMEGSGATSAPSAPAPPALTPGLQGLANR